jgi:hypothetical protein
MKIDRRNWLAAAAMFCSVAAGARGNEITDWNRVFYEAANVPPATSPLNVTRSAAIFQAAIFDAVNGIERRFTPVHVRPNGPPGASRRAAAVQAAYAILARLYPGQIAKFDQERERSLAGMASGVAAENSESIRRGIEWGQTAADEIWAWRSSDGFSPAMSFAGDFGIGKWRPTPVGYAAGGGVHFKYMTPWVMNSPSQFRPGPPPALTSSQYADDFNETKSKGSAVSAVRTEEQTQYSRFWHSSQANYLWNQVAVALAEERRLTFSESSRLLAVLNVAVADAAIGCWDAKYEYIFWRPITAIVEAGNDGNALTVPDAGWTPLLGTPPHPEYLSGHACLSGAAARVLEKYFGNESSFSIETVHVPGVVRRFDRISDALAEVNNARIYAGIHFRTACTAGVALGFQVADYVMEYGLAPMDGNRAAAAQQ